jgi:hypothetical protein
LEDIKPLSCPKHNFLRNELFFNGFALKEEGSGVGKKLELPTSCVRVYILGSSKAPSSLSIILSGVNSSVVCHCQLKRDHLFAPKRDHLSQKFLAHGNLTFLILSPITWSGNFNHFSMMS